MPFHHRTIQPPRKYLRQESCTWTTETQNALSYRPSAAKFNTLHTTMGNPHVLKSNTHTHSLERTNAVQKRREYKKDDCTGKIHHRDFRHLKFWPSYINILFVFKHKSLMFYIILHILKEYKEKFLKFPMQEHRRQKN